MPAAPAVTGFVPKVTLFWSGYFLGRKIRHTVRPQGSRDWLLIYTLAGGGLYRFPGGEYTSRPDDVTLFRAGSLQDYQWSPTTRKWDLLYAHFTPRADWLPWLNWPEQGEGLMLLSLAESMVRRRVLDQLRATVQFCQGSQPRRQMFGLNALETALLWCDTVHSRHAGFEIDPRVRKVMEDICQKSSAPFSEPELARVAGLSRSRLRHLFAAQVGKSMRDFQEEQRLEKAQQLLTRSSMRIGEISDHLGFSNPFYFSLRFKKQFGENPRAFRQRREEENR